MTKIYLDNAATTKPSKEVLSAMQKINENYWGNPSSIHTVGQEAHNVLDEARETITSFLNCSFDEVIFTGGGSESDNLAIRGLLAAVGSRESGVGSESPNSRSSVSSRALPSESKTKLQTPNLPHVITSAIEHHAVLHTIEDLEKEGIIEATYLRPNSDGEVNPLDVEAAIKENTVLVSIMYVNNETGAVQPIREIGKIIHAINTSRESGVNGQVSGVRSQEKVLPTPNSQPQTVPRIYFHTDAVQAAEFFNMDVDWLGVDLLSMTAHKIHGPKGTGVLYIKKGTPIKSLITGGSHEFRKRAGTENVAGIIGLAVAVKSASALKGDKYAENGLSLSFEVKKIQTLKDKIITALTGQIEESYLNGSTVSSSPAIANISFFNAEGEAIILNLDFLGIAVSSGSACTSKSLEPSHVLSAMGIPPEKAHGSIRFSLSQETTEEEIDRVIEVLPGIVKKLREMSPFK